MNDTAREEAAALWLKIIHTYEDEPVRGDAPQTRAEIIDRLAAMIRATCKPKGEPDYPCDRCGKSRTKAEGGTTFTVCDECWDATMGEPEAKPRKKPRKPCSVCKRYHYSGDVFCEPEAREG